MTKRYAELRTRFPPCVTPLVWRGLRDHEPSHRTRGRTVPHRWDPEQTSRSTLGAVETDPELLDRLRGGDEKAFVMLVNRYQQPLLRLAQSIVASPAVAEEVVQDTWMGVVRSIDRFEGRSSLKTWLFRILVNRARSAGARERSQVPLEEAPAVDPVRFDADGQWADPLASWEEGSADRLDAAKWSPILKAAIEELPSRQRQIVILRDLEGLSSTEACGVLGITAGNQRILLHRGRSRLREVLDAAMRKD